MFLTILLSVALSTNTTIEDLMAIRDEILLLRQEVASLRKILVRYQISAEKDTQETEEDETNVKYPPFYNSQHGLKLIQQKNSMVGPKGGQSATSYSTLGSFDRNTKREELRNNPIPPFGKNQRTLVQNERYHLYPLRTSVLKSTKEDALPEANRPHFY